MRLTLALSHAMTPQSSITQRHCSFLVQGTEKKIYAIPPYTQVEPLKFEKQGI